MAHLFHTYLGRHRELEPDKAHSTVMGIICPLVIELTVTQNLGKAQTLEALVAVTPLHMMIM